MERVLLADDHPLLREALRATINRIRPDLEVDEADSLAAAKERLNSASFALVLLDLKLSDCEGFLGLLTLRSEHPKTTVAIVSARVIQSMRSPAEKWMRGEITASISA